MAAKKGQISRYFAGFIMLLLIVGLGGFGARNFGGSVQSVGTVGDVEIDVNRYSRALNDELRALQRQLGQPITLSQAQQFGVDQNVLQRLITSAAFENENQRLGLSVGDAEVQRQLLATPEFQGSSGSFERDTYDFVLERTGLTSSEYEASLRSEAASNILRLAVESGITAPNGYSAVIMEYIGERRSFSWLELSQASLSEPIPEPNETQLQDYFAQNGDQYMVPAAKQITYAWLSPDFLIDQIVVDDAALRALYDARDAEYNLPERRLVERLIFATQSEADAALSAIRDGSSTFNDAVAARGLTLSDVDLGDVTRAELGNAGDGVFGLADTGVSDVLETDFGPSIFRINAILSARSTPFEEARAALADEFIADSARRQVADMIGEIDDLLAGGATLEELADETDMQLGTIDWVEGTSEGIASYSGFQTAAAQVTSGDFPEVITLNDGAILALRLDATIAEHPDSFDNAREQVALDWAQEALDTQLRADAAILLAQLDAGATLSSLGQPVTVETNLIRSDVIDAAPPAFLQDVFALNDGQSGATESPGKVLIAQITAILPAETGTEEADTLRTAINDSVVQGIAQDALVSFTNNLVSQAGISINQSAVNAVHARFP